MWGSVWFWVLMMINKALYFLAVLLFFSGCSSGANDGGKKPLYWVAPMDANYRRDEPGQSPMGMDLVPVYEASDSGDSVGVVSIVPEIQNQLGVRRARVEMGVLKQELRSYGRIIFDRTLVSKLSPRVSGWVDMLFVSTEGEMIKRGQPLYSLYSPELVKAQEVFLMALRGRNKTQILEAETALHALKVDNISISRLRNEGVAQQGVIFHSPKDGVLGMLKIGEDYYVEPGDAMLAIGSLEDVWVELDVFESQASLIKPRQRLSFTTPAHPGRVWEGEVDYIYPALKSASKSLRFRAKIENANMLLKPNMQVQALIELPERASVPIIPQQALIRLGQYDRVVLSLGDGRFKSVNVLVGESNSEQVEILDGIEEGDWIVTSAHFLIDSESSKTSDFKRMLALDDPEDKYPATWVNAVVKEVNLAERKLRLEHEFIDAWKMPSMTMNFQVVDGVGIQLLNVGDPLRVKVADGDPLFQVIEIERLDVGEEQ